MLHRVLAHRCTALAPALLGTACCLALLLPLQAQAALGQSLAQPASAGVAGSASAPDTALARQLRTQAPLAQSSLYTVSNTQLPTGTLVTEYATPAGLVFAVSWKGPVLPELDGLLGSHFAHFKASAQASRAQRNLGTPLGISDQGLVLQSSGRMGHFSGYAYLSALVPDGVDISTVLP